MPYALSPLDLMRLGLGIAIECGWCRRPAIVSPDGWRYETDERFPPAIHECRRG